MTLQNDAGTVSGADSYISVDTFKSYHNARGNDYSAYTDTVIGEAIVRASDYIDSRFTFDGTKINGRDQTTEFPRYDVYDRDSYYVEGIPLEIKDATAEYALRALTVTLNPDPTVDASGRKVESESVTVGPISESKTFTGPVSSMPKYPAVDTMLLNSGFVHGIGQRQVQMNRG